MLTNFIYSQSKGLFLEQLQAGNVPEDAIAFLEDSGEIWNRDHYFGSTGVSNLLTEGKLIGTITANNNPYNIYAPKTYDWSEITGTGNVLTTAGGIISGDLTIKKENGDSTLILGTNGRVIDNPTDGSTSLYNGGSGYPALKVQAGLGHPVFRYNYKDYVLLHSGNYTEYTLPKTGGVIKGLAPYHQYMLTLDTDNAYYTILSLKSQGVRKGDFRWTSDETTIVGVSMYNATTKDALGLSDDGLPMYNKNTLLHSGNIGEYAVKYFGNQGSINFNDALYNGVQYTSSSSSNNGRPSCVLLSLRHGDTAMQIVGGRSTGNLMYRGGNGTADSWSDWKTIAFTDSNVASATKLQTARTIWGQSFDGTANVSGIPEFPFCIGVNRTANGSVVDTSKMGFVIETYASIVSLKGYNTSANNIGGIHINSSGNVTIGRYDLTTTIEKFVVDGNMTSRSTTATTRQVVARNSVGDISIGVNESGGCWLYTGYNNPISIYTNGQERMRIANNGNVLIGATTDDGSGAKLQVAGDITINGISLLEKLTNIEQSSDTLEDYVQENRSKSTEAINTANTAKNAVATLEGLANATTAQTTLAATVTQIEQNTTDIKVLQDMYVLMTVAEYEALEIKDSDKIYMLYEE